MMKLTLAISSDHAGYDLKTAIIEAFSDQYHFNDLGCDSLDKVDYPDQAEKLVTAMTSDSTLCFGILLCGSGIGISIAANRHAHIRAALCHNPLTAQLARQHNNANVLALGARIIDEQTAFACVNSFLKTEFEGGRHLARVQKL